MPPKAKFSKEDIIDAAFELASAEGIDHITIRKIAEKLGSSIAPIYVNFADVEELKKAVILKIHEVSQEMLMTRYTDNPFLNIGIASLKFAKAYPVLFNDLITNQRAYLQDVQPKMSGMLDMMGQDPELQGFSQEELMDIFFKMQIFQLGLSVMDVHGMFPEPLPEEKLVGILESAGTDIIAAAHLRKKAR